MNVVFMGTPDFAVKTLEKLVEKHNVVAVVTQPDKPKGRGKKMVFPVIKEKAIEYGLPILQPENAKESAFVEELKKYDADIFVVAAYGQILTEDVLYMPKYGSVNVHGSLLPKYRGAAPIQWSIINGDNTTGVTIMHMAKGLDSGDIIIEERIAINNDDTYGSLGEKMSLVGAELLIKTIADIEKGSAKRTPQNHSLSTYAPMVTRETGHIDWSKASEEISCLVRGLDPQPGAYALYNDEILKIWKIEIIDKIVNNRNFGEIIDSDKKGFYVKTGNGVVLVSAIQAKGGKVMSTDAYMRGHTIKIGTILK